MDNVLQARMAAMVHGVSGRESLNGVDENEIRGEVIMRDPICQTHTLLAMRVYAAALKIDTKHVFQALPRLLSLWFDLVSVAREQLPSESGSKQDPLRECNSCNDPLISTIESYTSFTPRNVEASSKSGKYVHGDSS